MNMASGTGAPGKMDGRREAGTSISAGNGSGDQPVDMAAYDRLPPEIREVLRYSPVPFSAASVIANYRQHGCPPMSAYVAHMRAVLTRRFPGWEPGTDKPGRRRAARR